MTIADYDQSLDGDDVADELLEALGKVINNEHVSFAYACVKVEDGYEHYIVDDRVYRLIGFSDVI